MPIPYVPPTAVTFKARFPEFAAVDDTVINPVLAEAIDTIGVTWYERDRAAAQMYWTAHTLTMQGYGPGGAAGGGSISTGPVKRRRVGDVETEFAGSTVIHSGGSGSGSPYELTSYGQNYLRIAGQNFPAIVAV